MTKIVKRNGRIILNDELGVGKRLVAISSAIVYKSEWPLLIVCPQVLQVLWKEEFVKWIPNFDQSKIQIYSGAPGEELRNNAAIFIVSYQNLLSPQSCSFDALRAKHFQVAIIDEASVLKKKEARWEESIINFFTQMKRVLLLTGSMLTSNPIDIHNLVKIVRPDCIPDFLRFSQRFCDP